MTSFMNGPLRSQYSYIVNVNNLFMIISNQRLNEGHDTFYINGNLMST